MECNGISMSNHCSRGERKTSRDMRVGDVIGIPYPHESGNLASLYTCTDSHSQKAICIIMTTVSRTLIGGTTAMERCVRSMPNELVLVIKYVLTMNMTILLLH